VILLGTDVVAGEFFSGISERSIESADSPAAAINMTESLLIEMGR
jgi:hypothetical protein